MYVKCSRSSDSRFDKLSGQNFLLGYDGASVMNVKSLSRFAALGQRAAPLQAAFVYTKAMLAATETN